MDNFLQLVPMEADADDSDSALVYGEEDDLAGHDGGEPHDVLCESAAATDDSAAQFFAPLAQFVTASAPAAPPPSTTLTPDQQRARFLRLLQLSLEHDAHAVRTSLDKRLDAVHRVRALDGHPAEQLAEYLPLLAPQQRERESGAEDVGDRGASIAAELLACARQMSDPRDTEVALLAAFVFLSDAPGSPKRGSIAPAIAAVLLDESNAALVGEHPHQHQSF
jgi:hypothetical protein